MKTAQNLFLGLFICLLAFSLISSSQGKTSGVNTGSKGKFNEKEAQLNKNRVNLKDKIDGTIESIFNRINLLKDYVTARRTSHAGLSEDELKSMALSIKSDIDKAKEDISNYMTNGDIFMSERDTYLQKIDGLKSMLKDLRVVDPTDLEKS
jgi:hypothetical protein